MTRTRRESREITVQGKVAEDEQSPESNAK